jgi:hypothetical protein
MKQRSGQITGMPSRPNIRLADLYIQTYQEFGGDSHQISARAELWPNNDWGWHVLLFEQK